MKKIGISLVFASVFVYSAAFAYAQTSPAVSSDTNTVLFLGGVNFSSTAPSGLYPVFNDVWSSFGTLVHWTNTLPANTPAGAAQFQVSDYASGFIPMDAVYLNGKVYVISKSGVWSSADKGATWTNIQSSVPWFYQGGKAVVFNNKIMFIGSRSYGSGSAWFAGAETWSSADGITWTKSLSTAASAPGTPTIVCGGQPVVFQNKVWLLGDRSNGTAVCSSFDGTNWKIENSHTPWTERQVTLLSFNNKLWVIGGYDEVSGTTFTDVWSSSDGVTWTKVGNSPALSTLLGNWSVTVAYDNKIFLFPDQSNAVWSSTDGLTWTLVKNTKDWPLRGGAVVLVVPPETQSALNTGNSAGTVVLQNQTTGSQIQPAAYGTTSTNVTAIQTILIAKGYLHASASGYFGLATVAAVKSFQAANGLSIVGSVGPLTARALSTK